MKFAARRPTLLEVLGFPVGSPTDNLAVFRELVRFASDPRETRPESKLFWARVAGQFAWMNHPGLHASPEIEALVSSLAVPTDQARTSSGRPERILHVLTQAYGTGGHTRLAWRWIESDPTRRSSVVLTAQGWHPIPASLARAVGASGGQIADLTGRGTLARAAALRRIAQRADIVVLHVHPYDVTPILALSAWPDRPATIFVNHADHVFWLGVNSSDVIASLRPASTSLSAERRGVERSRLIQLPLPLKVPDTDGAATNVRWSLGIPDDAVLVISIASAYKYRSEGGPDFIEALAPIVRAHERMHVVVAGPRSEGRWADAERSLAGRLRAIGPIDEPDPLYAAADIYVDSIPMSSLTSLLEAGLRGLPVVALRGDPAYEILSSVDLPGLDLETIGIRDLHAFRQMIARLVERDNDCRSLGDQASAQIRATYTGSGWASQRDAVYDQALRARAQSSPGSMVPALTSDALAVRLASLQTDDAGLAAAIAAHLGGVSWVERARLIADLARVHRTPAPLQLDS